MSILDGASSRPASQPRRRHGRGRGLVVAIVALLLLVGIAVVVDRVVNDRVEAGVAENLAASYAGEDVDLTIGGFPFLTQLASGTFRDVELTAASAVYEGYTLTDLDARATDLPYDVATQVLGRAGTVSATATIPTATLESLAATQLADADLTLTTRDGALVAGTEVLGGLTVDIGLLPRAADGQIAVDIGTVSIAGFEVPLDQLPAGLADRLTDIRIDLPGLPAGLGLTSLEVVETGVRATVEGVDVDLAEAAA
ncbi:hypothetical protein C8046_10010 [Serinibacter arcticus]|uniref:Secreted protein n=1 Tax=Serinibacter arcticus TaxID=1655435 RepID=A0A2U1ZVC2_9MICO|nr:DUF2993 domain-containing protein [Serinibacter arcticus]PWD50936.1 hypothetical protein C8046_10010 [Serinibacter arcticus]